MRLLASPFGLAITREDQLYGEPNVAMIGHDELKGLLRSHVINDLSSIHCDALYLKQLISSYYLYETRKRFKINTYRYSHAR
jgi:hypothetical protein